MNELPQDALDGGRPLHVLMVGTEWFPLHGGLSRFNKDLATALAAQGHHITCTTKKKPTRPERKDADARGVRLVTPEDLGAFPAELRGRRVDVVVGHTRQTSGAARVQAREHFGSVLASFAHTIPEKIELLKGKPAAEAARDAQERTVQVGEALRVADLVYAVGPGLTRYWQDWLGPQHQVRQVVPGIDPTTPAARPGTGPARCLLPGRAEDWTIKGIDIAARAFTQAACKDATLVVMGAPDGEGPALANRLCREFQISPRQVQTIEYDPNPERVDQELRAASVVLMPSRAEGFGLVALEALERGVPVLVSDRSGMGDFLRAHASGAADLVVPVRDDPRDPHRWGQALQSVLDDRDGRFAQARQTRAELAPHASWDTVATSMTSDMRAAVSARSGTPRPPRESLAQASFPTSLQTGTAPARRPDAPARRPHQRSPGTGR